jgi:putative restriction endonuclease
MFFVTKEKQQTLTQYQDHFDGDQLHWEGETNHGNDTRIVHAESVGDETQLFYRHRHHSPFTYYGQIHLFSHDPRATEPGRFVFTTARTEVAAVSAIATEDRMHGTDDATFVADGRRSR